MTDSQPSGQPPIVVQSNQDGGGGSSAGVVAAVAIVALVLIGIWWFGFGPGAGGATDGTEAPPASTAPIESVPASE